MASRQEDAITLICSMSFMGTSSLMIFSGSILQIKETFKKHAEEVKALMTTNFQIIEFSQLQAA
jgi:hypothetical protein